MDNQAPEPRPEQDTAFQELKGFRVLQELARSPKGIVYRARRLVEQDIVAVKVFRPALCEKKFVSELPQHAESSFMLDHPGLIKSLGCINESGRILLIMDYAAGESAARALRRKVSFSVLRGLRIVLHCANALRYAALHKCTHGRLHPADIILGEEDARILGVGLGEKPEHPGWSVRDPYIFEPLIYTAPEAMPSRIYPSELPSRVAVDIYSLGAILFHLLSGQTPFIGTDEDSLVVERKGLKSPVLWPAPPESVPGLPTLQPQGLDLKSLPEIKALIEKMLAPDPAARPGYDDVISILSKTLLKGEHFDPRPVLVPLPSNTKAGQGQSENSEKKDAVAARINLPAAASPTGTATQISPVQLRSELYPQSPVSALAERLYTTALVGMTAIVFLFAIALSVKILWYDRPEQTHIVRPLPPVKTPIMEIQKPVKSAEPSPESVQSGTEQALAMHQIEKIQDMLKKGEMQHSAGLLRVVRGLAEKVGKDTPTGIKAVVLAAEIEETLIQKYNAATNATKEPPANVPAPQPVPAPVAPPAEKPAAPKDTSKIADNAKAPSVPEQPAKTGTVLMAALRAAAQKVKKFQYNDAREELAKLVAGAEGDERKKCDTYLGLVQYEQALFERCRTRLLDRIAKHPQHNSPLQVFPKKNDPVGEDIVDFDEAGLKIAVKKGLDAGVRTQTWDSVPARQAMALLQLLVEDKTSMDDQLGLAAFALNHGLKPGWQAVIETIRGLTNGAESSAMLEDQYKMVSGIIDGSEPAK